MMYLEMLETDTQFIYDLSLGENAQSLNISTYPQGRALLQAKLSNPLQRPIPNLRTNLDLGQFISPENERWGFAQRVRWAQGKNQPVIICPLPQFDTNSPSPLKPFFEISATLKTILHQLNNTPQMDPQTKKQLLSIDLTIEEKPASAAMGVNIAKAFAPFFKSSAAAGLNALAESAMKSAYAQINGPSAMDASQHSIKAHLNSQPFYLTCTGHSGLVLDDPIEDGRGFRFGTSNVDSPIQQLTLLAGLAALNQAARISGY